MSVKSKLDTGEFVLLAEMEPPKGADVSRMVTNASRVKGDVDAFLVPEMSSAVMRMSSLGGAMILQGKGMETVMQFNCRDRNRLALQADMLAANACGINNIMAVTGEDPSFGDHHEASAVYDIELLGLLEAIQGLQAGKDMAGIDLSGSPQFLVGSTVNTGLKGEPLERELDDMNHKRDAGAQFFISPPLFDFAAIEPILKRVDDPKTHIIPTVLLLKSLGMARYIARNIDYIHLPESLIKRIEKTGDKVRECVRIAGEMITLLKKEKLGGVLISTMGWEPKIPDILGEIKG